VKPVLLAAAWRSQRSLQPALPAAQQQHGWLAFSGYNGWLAAIYHPSAAQYSASFSASWLWP